MYKLLALAFATYFFASQSFAAPRAQSAEECGIAADMALVAQSERGQALMKKILDAAYLTNTGATAPKLAEELFTACMSSGGNMDAVLGRSL